MKAWKKRLLWIFCSSVVSSYCHGMLWAWLSTSGISHWATWAEHVSIAAGIVAAASGFGVFLAFMDDRMDDKP